MQHKTRSTTDTDPATVEATERTVAGRSPCTCGWCQTAAVATATDTHTGEVETVERQSRALVCPRCGGYNEKLRRRRVAHVAAWIRRHTVHKSALKFVTVAVHDVTSEVLDGYKESYQFMTGPRGAYTNALKRLRYRAPGQLDYTGVVAARPSNEQAHFHLLVISDLSTDALHEALHGRGLDVDVKTPSPTDSADDFAACMAHYCVVNAVRAEVVGGTFRFVASRNRGLGYHSKAATDRRKAYAERRAERGAERRAKPRNVQPSTTSSTSSPGDKPGAADSIASKTEKQNNGRTESGQNREDNGHSGQSLHQRPPPIQGEGKIYATKQTAKAAIRRLLSKRRGTLVHVDGHGAARLLQWLRLSAVVVHVEGEERARTVSWHDLDVVDAPKLLTSQSTRHTETDMQSAEHDATETEHDGKSEYDALHDRLEATPGALRYSRVTIDGHTTIKDHDTGKVYEEDDPECPI